MALTSSLSLKTRRSKKMNLRPFSRKPPGYYTGFFHGRKVAFTVSAVAVQAPNVLFSPAGSTLPMPLSGGRSAPTFRPRDSRELRGGAASGLNETDVGARELQGSGIAADVPEGFHSV